jgi:hypothetical protein
MTKRSALGAILLLAACSKAPEDGNMPTIAGNATAGVAFAYRYAFELPSRSIDDLQESHAQACERAGLAVCRITDLSYRVSRDGQASASLSVKVAAPVARRFGRDAMTAADGFGGTLVAAEISGEEVQTAISGADTSGRTAARDAAMLDRSLANPRLSSAERTQIRARRDARTEAARADAATAADQSERLANTPMSFSYQAGHGVGFANALRDSADAALGSTRVTVIGATWVLATLGPPTLLLLLVWLAWRRWGRRAWLRLAEQRQP